VVPVACAPLPESPSAWVLELGAAARRAQFRSSMYAEQGRHLRSWSSRREAARARRRHVQALLAGKAAAHAVDPPVMLPPVVAELDDGAWDDTGEVPGIPAALPPPDPPPRDEVDEEDFGPALRERIAAYTLSSP
jgi:hypothetical protein